MTEDSTLELPTEARPGARPVGGPPIVQVFALALGALLLGYMFLGRGFAHLGVGPIYVGDLVLGLGLVTAAFAAARGGRRAPLTWTLVILVAYMVLGAVRTVPYLGTYGLDALRDAVVWGYAAFAIVVYLLADRRFVDGAFRAYGWIVPVFAFWLPISWNLFMNLSAGIDPNRPGEVIPLVFFKGGDMAVHTVGAVAFLVLGASAVRSARQFAWRTVICLPLLWTSFVAGTHNRGALVTIVVGILVLVILAPRSRNWLPLLAAVAVFAVALVAQSVLPTTLGTASAAAGATPAVSVRPEASAGAGAAVPSATQGPSGPPGASFGVVSASPPTGSPAGSASAIANPGFEVGPVMSGGIEGWFPGTAGAYNIVSGGAHGGEQFATVENVLNAYEATLTSARFPFKAGDDIAVSAWVKAVAARPALEIYVNWYDSAGTRIASVFLGDRRTGGDRTWQECSGVLEAPAGTAQAELLFYEANGHATIGIDDVTVRAGDFIVKPPPPQGRPATLQQMFENILSIFGSSSDQGLEGSKQFRLAWWGTIVDYTVFGEYRWVGKGFGVNLADSDGFQSTADHSLRSPHNTTMTVLARMGVPGLLLWLIALGAFGVGLLRSMLAFRRGGDIRLAAISGFLLAYWIAMLVDTSFDPYLEGPQGGIWFWVVFGLGLAVMNLGRRAHESA